MATDHALHADRMRSLVAFTETSCETDCPSPFGASIYEVVSGQRVAQAYDSVMADCDPTAHGEMNAIRQATRARRELSLRGCILYSTCEPCPMCMSACIWAELDAVVFGASTAEDAEKYWPQASNVTPFELVSRMLRPSPCLLIPHVERSLCQELFRRCDEARHRRQLEMPPHREGGAEATPG